MAFCELVIEQCAQPYRLQRLVHHRQAAALTLRSCSVAVSPEISTAGIVLPSLARSSRIASMPVLSPRRRRSAMMKSGERPLMLAQSLGRVHRSDALAAPALQQALHAEAHRFLVVDHHDELAADQIRHLLLDRRGNRMHLLGSAIGTSTVKREPLPTSSAATADDRAAARCGVRSRGPAQSARAIARRIVELIELFEDALVLLGGMPMPVSHTSTLATLPADGMRRGCRRSPCNGASSRRGSTAHGTTAWRRSRASASSGAP